MTLFDYDPKIDESLDTKKVTYFMEKKFLGKIWINLYDILIKGKYHNNIYFQKPLLIVGY